VTWGHGGGNFGISVGLWTRFHCAVLRTIGDARAYMVALPKNREKRTHWQHASRLLLQEAGAPVLTRQVHVALFMDGKLDAGPFEHMSSARRWRRHTLT
jgi:hypothetical protein